MGDRFGSLQGLNLHAKTRTRNKRRHNIRDAGGVRDYDPGI